MELPLNVFESIYVGEKQIASIFYFTTERSTAPMEAGVDVPAEKPAPVVDSTSKIISST